MSEKSVGEEMVVSARRWPDAPVCTFEFGRKFVTRAVSSAEGPVDSPGVKTNADAKSLSTDRLVDDISDAP
jgi:hypothetical protein